MNHILETAPTECSPKGEVPNGISKIAQKHYCLRGQWSIKSILKSYTVPSNIIQNVRSETLQSSQALQISEVSYKANSLS